MCWYFPCGGGKHKAVGRGFPAAPAVPRPRLSSGLGCPVVPFPLFSGGLSISGNQMVLCWRICTHLFSGLPEMSGFSADLGQTGGAVAAGVRTCRLPTMFIRFIPDREKLM